MRNKHKFSVEFFDIRGHLIDIEVDGRIRLKDFSDSAGVN
jgi:hypothetical protein